MMIPCEIGVSPIGDVTYSERVKELLVRLQGQGGYSSAEDSARVLELLSMAYALGESLAAIDTVADGIFPQHTVPLLEEHESARRVPNDAPRSILERQRRLLAIDAAGARPSAERIEAALERLGVTAATVPYLRTQVALEGAEDVAILQGLVTISEADWASPARRRGAIDLLRRMRPVVSYGQMHHASPAELVVTSIDATWGSAAHVLGRCAISAGAAWTPNRAASRVKSYARSSRLTARDLLHLQSLAAIGACSGADNTLFATPSTGRRLAFAALIPATSTVAIISGVDMREKVVRAITRDSTNDIRPGQASDTTCNASSEKAHLWYTGTGGLPYSSAIGSTPWGQFEATATGLDIENTSVDARYVVGWIEYVDGHDSGTTEANLATVEDGYSLSAGNATSEPINAAWWASTRDSVAVTAANGAGADVWPAFPSDMHGGLHRCAVVAHSIKPVADGSTFVLDATEDWRDRVLIVEYAIVRYANNDIAFFPGCSGDDAFAIATAAGTRLGFTGAGVVAGGSALLAHHVHLDTGVRIGARSTDGALIFEHSSAFVGDTHACAVLTVHATDQLGARSAANTLAPPTTPVDAAAIQPAQLNWLQDISMLSQGRGLPASLGVTGINCDAMPLGPITHGDPKIPRAWMLKRRDGIANTDRVEVRQAVAGSLRRVFACAIVSGAVVLLDDTRDWRDRFVGSLVAWGATDMRPGGANDDQITAATQNKSSWYSGAGRPTDAGAGSFCELRLDVGLSVYAHQDTGYLHARNATGATVYLVGWFDASFQLGPRS